MRFHENVAPNSFLPYEGRHPISFESPPKLLQSLVFSLTQQVEFLLEDSSNNSLYYDYNIQIKKKKSVFDNHLFLVTNSYNIHHINNKR